MARAVKEIFMLSKCGAMMRAGMSWTSEEWRSSAARFTPLTCANHARKIHAGSGIKDSEEIL